jgi:hypothetical protein
MDLHCSAVTASALSSSPYAFSNFIPNLNFHRDNQPPVTLKSLWPRFLANSSDLLFIIELLTHTFRPVTIENQPLIEGFNVWTLTFSLLFLEVPCCPWRDVHSSQFLLLLYNACSYRFRHYLYLRQLAMTDGRGWHVIFSSNAVFLSECYITPRYFCGDLKF